MTGQHVTTLADMWAMNRPWALPMTAAPRHSTATHVHDFKIVAVFEGLRESIGQCACGETKTVFHTEADS